MYQLNYSLIFLKKKKKKTQWYLNLSFNMWKTLPDVLSWKKNSGHFENLCVLMCICATMVLILKISFLLWAQCFIFNFFHLANIGYLKKWPKKGENWKNIIKKFMELCLLQMILKEMWTNIACVLFLPSFSIPKF